MNKKYGVHIVVKHMKKLHKDEDKTIVVALLCDVKNHKWWRIRTIYNSSISDVDLGIKTFSNMKNIQYDEDEDEIFERLD